MSPNASAPPRDKQSLGYIVRSGIAGGVAGCVVRTSGFESLRCALLTDTLLLGQDGRRAAGQSQDPFPSLQSGFPEVCRELEWGVSCWCGYLQGGRRLGSLPGTFCNLDPGLSLCCDKVYGL